jgi:geranylgeranyl reductase family protein
MRYEQVVIVGGGPSGAYCATELARKGIYATILDHSHPREKPCGGGISSVALSKFRFLEKFRSKGCSNIVFEIISCTNKRVAKEPGSGFNISRQYLDEELLKTAIRNGATLIKEKVCGIERKQSLWRIKTSKQTLMAGILVGADGVNSIVRRKTAGAIAPENFGLTYGYLARRIYETQTIIKFLYNIPGYIWVFPRGNHTSIGVISEIKYGRFLKPMLDDFFHSRFPDAEVLSKFAAMLPFAKDPKFFKNPCAGENWLLIGDSAGHTDPLTGEGILYALWSGKLAASAIARNDVKIYDELWRENYGRYLMKRCSQKNAFYNPLMIELSVMHQSLCSKLRARCHLNGGIRINSNPKPKISF